MRLRISETTDGLFALEEEQLFSNGSSWKPLHYSSDMKGIERKLEELRSALKKERDWGSKVKVIKEFTI